MKIGSNKDINKNNKKLPMTLREPGKAEDAAPITVKTADKPDRFAAVSAKGMAA